MIDILKLKSIAMEAAYDAGRFLLEFKIKEKEIYEEKGRDIKLILDQESEKLIRSRLQSTDLQILGEEFGGNITEDNYWVIDPIDGTANYFRGLDQCCVSIALMNGCECLVGVIYNFNNDEMYTSAKNHGAFLNDEKIRVSKIDSRKKASITTGFPASESIESSMNFLNDLKGWKKVRMFGSAALSCAYVASGKCDYYSEKGVFLWDFAAGICLVKEAGGSVSLSLIDENRYEVIFSNSLL
mgnify:FL=1|tara:strand:- start:722 stop:1444 length:723 start_codon:yes stop_codon:yes gene_type:complete